MGGASCILPASGSSHAQRNFVHRRVTSTQRVITSFVRVAGLLQRDRAASVSLNVTHYGQIKFRFSLCNYNVFCSPRKLLCFVSFCPGTVPRLLHFLRFHRTSIADNLRSSFSLERFLFPFLVRFCSFFLRFEQNYLIPVDNISQIGTRCKKLSRQCRASRRNLAHLHVQHRTE